MKSSRLAQAAGLVMLFVLGCNTAGQEAGQGGGNGGGGGSVTAEGIALAWQVAGDSLEVTVTAPTTGWVAVGFDPTPGMGMKDANLVIGYVQGGAVHIRDNYGTSPASHAADTSAAGGRDNVTDKQGQESEGSTRIRFKMPLDSGDAKDRALVPGNTYTVLLAHGPNESDGFETYHGTTRVAVQIKL